MQFTTVLFDLDGTLLPMDQEEFTKAYFKLLAGRIAPLGYEPKQLIDSIWQGTAAMVKNNGKCLNEEAFWKKFTEIHGEKSREHEPNFAEFYRTDFQLIKQVCGFAPEAAEIVGSLKAMGKRVVLATNPIFPAIATESRMKWAGLEPSDFELYTTYENTGFCKPNLDYYRDILRRIGCKAEECLMVGNDVGEDMIAAELGMKVFLLTDCIINKQNSDVSGIPQGSFAQLKEFIGIN